MFGLHLRLYVQALGIMRNHVPSHIEHDKIFIGLCFEFLQVRHSRHACKGVVRGRWIDNSKVHAMRVKWFFFSIQPGRWGWSRRLVRVSASFWLIGCWRLLAATGGDSGEKQPSFGDLKESGLKVWKRSFHDHCGYFSPKNDFHILSCLRVMSVWKSEYKIQISTIKVNKHISLKYRSIFLYFSSIFRHFVSTPLIYKSMGGPGVWYSRWLAFTPGIDNWLSSLRSATCTHMCSFVQCLLPVWMRPRRFCHSSVCQIKNTLLPILEMPESITVKYSAIHLLAPVQYLYNFYIFDS